MRTRKKELVSDNLKPFIGKLIKETGIIGFDSFEKSLYDVLKPSKHFLIPDEMKALKAGFDY